MTPDRERKAARICEAALHRPALEREAFIVEACAGDEALRREVESLLRQQSKTDEFLQQPALDIGAEEVVERPALNTTTASAAPTPTEAGSTEAATRPVPLSTTRAGRPANPANSASPLAVGENFGSRYHIIRLLGIGGMGAVYQAWDQVLDVAVAVKVIRPPATMDAEEAQGPRATVQT